jgi:hypothetical protein
MSPPRICEDVIRFHKTAAYRPSSFERKVQRFAKSLPNLCASLIILRKLFAVFLCGTTFGVDP